MAVWPIVVPSSLLVGISTIRQISRIGGALRGAGYGSAAVATSAVLILLALCLGNSLMRFRVPGL